MYDTEALAGQLYDAYCKVVGGKAFNNDPLPTWKDFRADPNKKRQSDGWVVVAELAVQALVTAEDLKRMTPEYRVKFLEVKRDLTSFSDMRSHGDFRKELEHAINRHSMENGSDTPDFILAEYLAGCLDAFDKALAARTKWYGSNLSTTNTPRTPEPIPAAPVQIGSQEKPGA